MGEQRWGVFIAKKKNLLSTLVFLFSSTICPFTLAEFHVCLPFGVAIHSIN